jgi:hypothetical protein
MFEILLIGVLAAIAKFVTLMKIGQLRRLLALDALLDLLASMLFAFLFFGTLTGMSIAAIAGLTFSLIVWVYKGYTGYERLRLRNWRLVWETVPARWGKLARA